MNKEWSELNKEMQFLIKKHDKYKEGIEALNQLRNMLMNTISSFKTSLSQEDFCAIPFINANGYHSKTVAYSLWHIFRIEDIVAHSLIADDNQVLFRGNYQKRICSPIITTGNELIGQEIYVFSSMLNIDELYEYITEVKEETEKILNNLQFEMLNKKITSEQKKNLLSLNVVSESEKAIWLVDYWCNKDIRGLIQMPFSRHWIMHIEACLRIINRIHK